MPAVPIAALLATPIGSTDAADEHPAFPRLAGVLGPMPPSAPVHVALASLSSGQRGGGGGVSRRGVASGGKPSGVGGTWAESAPAPAPAPGRNPHPNPTTTASTAATPVRPRVLIITGPKSSWQTALEAADEPALRRRWGYSLRAALNRVDVRYCPTSDHVRLLLIVLTGERSNEGERGAHEVDRPGLVVLWDVARLFMQPEGAVEGGGGGEGTDRAAEMGVGDREGGRDAPDVDMPDVESTKDPKLAFMPHITSAHYLEIISAAIATAQHLNTCLLVLEPNFAPDSSLPIIAQNPSGHSGSTRDTHTRSAQMVPPHMRERRVKIAGGLERLMGPESVFGIFDLGDNKYDLRPIGPSDATNRARMTMPLHRKRSAISTFAAAPRPERQGAGANERAGVPPEQWGWQWVWG